MSRAEYVGFSEELETPDLKVYRGLFGNTKILSALHRHILTEQSERKVTHALSEADDHLPEAVAGALYVPRSMGFINTPITKRYMPGEPSDAFERHRDPDKYAGNPISISTIGGEAVLNVIAGDESEYDIYCPPDCTVVLEPGLLHAVTEPINEPRTILFAGYGATLLDT